MFRPMRRSRQELSRERAEDILRRGTHGVLAVTGDDGYPYAVPLSYAYEDGAIYFHGANTGHKLDGIRTNDKVSFCVVDKDEVIPEEFTTYFRSVIAFGRAHILTDEADLRHAAELMAMRYSPLESIEHRDRAIAAELPSMSAVRIDIEHLSGKQAIELVRREQQ